MISDGDFPKEEHLLKTGDFRKVYKNGSAHKRDPLFLYRLPNAGETIRVGFSVSSRSIKLATRRNRIKRLLREAYRLNKAKLKKGFDIVIVVRRDPSPALAYKDIEKKFLGVAGEAGILK
ncbi:MAG: ribonuclease P protein component [Candidatus Omnitrophota bacterium]